MRILVVTERLDREGHNGSEVFAGELCAVLERRHELCLVTRGEPRSALSGSSPVVVLGDEMARPAASLAAFLKARLRLDDFDLVYNLGGLLFGSQITHVLGLLGGSVPVVNHFQALLGSYARYEGLDEIHQQAHATLQRAVSRAAVLNIFPSLAELQQAAREGYGSPLTDAIVIPNGVSREAFRDLEPDGSHPSDRQSPENLGGSGERPLILATAGRFSDYVKGADLVYRAFAELRRDRRDVFLLSIGNAPRFAEILKGLPEDCFRLRPWLPRRRFLAALAAADAVVLPSRYEPFGMIAVEAMMLGLPVVASAVGGLREIVSHGETGLLSNPEDGSLGLYEALCELAADREAARAMGEAGRRRAETVYEIERVACRVEQAFHLAVLDSRARPVRSILADFGQAELA